MANLKFLLEIGTEEIPDWMIEGLSAFLAHMVTSEAILLRDFITCLHRGFLCPRPERNDSGEKRLLVAKFKASDAPGDLRFVGVRKNFEAGREHRV